MNHHRLARVAPSVPLSRYSGGGPGWGRSIPFRHSDLVIRISCWLLISGLGVPALAQLPPDRPPAANAPVDNILTDLYERGRNLKDFTADVTLAETDPVTQRSSTRSGQVFYQVKPADGDARIRVSFDTYKASGPASKEHIEYLLDNGVLVDQNFRTKLQVTRQVLKPGQKLNPLKLGEGPFPLPLGQPPEEVRKNFDVKLNPSSKDDPATGTTHATLTPKEGTRFAKRFDTIDVWVSRKDNFPVRIETADKNGGTVRTTDLTNLKVNTGLTDATFKLPEPGKDWGVRNEELNDSSSAAPPMPALDDPPFTVYERREVVAGTERNVVSTYDVKFLIRRSDAVDPKALTPAYAFRGTHVPTAARVLLDGTLLLTEDTGALIVAKPGQAPATVTLRIDAAVAHPLAVYRDGVIAQAADLNTARPLYFIPARAGGWDVTVRVRVSDATGTPVNAPPTFHRAATRLVWMTHTGQHEAEGPPYSILHTFDLKTGDARAFPFDRTRILRDVESAAGRTRALLDDATVDLDTGSLTPLPPATTDARR